MNESLHAPIRVHAFSGLVIDVDTWATAHDYHRSHLQLHLLSLHGAGVAQGLEVLPTDPPSNNLVIEPGIGIDSLGNVVVMPERQQISIGDDSGLCFVVLDYVESIPPAGPDRRDTRARIKEDSRLRVVRAAPDSNSIELARVAVGAEAKQLIPAANPWAPAENEIDLRFRPQLHPAAPRPVSIALLVCGDETKINPSHMLGFQFFLRELEFAGFRPLLAPASEDVVPEADLIYITAASDASVSSALIKRIRERVSQGSWLLVDPCGSETGMLEAFNPLLKVDEAKTARTENLVLGSRFVFGTAPPGAFPTRKLLWGENVILSPCDYGCAWSGRRGEDVFQRDLVRAALEFGVNVAASVGDHARRAS